MKTGVIELLAIVEKHAAAVDSKAALAAREKKLRDTALAQLETPAEQIQIKRSRRSKRAGVKHRHYTKVRLGDAVSEGEGEATSSAPATPPETSAAHVATEPHQVGEESIANISCANKPEAVEETAFANSTSCIRCRENGVLTPAKMNPYTGLVMCDTCTAIFYDQNVREGYMIPGRATMLPDPNVVIEEENSESSFEYDADFKAQGRVPLAADDVAPNPFPINRSSLVMYQTFATSKE